MRVEPSPRQHPVLINPPRPHVGFFEVPDGPGLGLTLDDAELAKRRVPIA
jgi:L-alanine-DL-glutamate epimerase-like enolase superfamily enzyme